VDERDLTKLISCVFLNAVKFTECGKITVAARLNPSPRYIVVTVTDTGPGIPQTFLPYLFKPFSREDDSLTRQKDGLGLGLLVAKGLARKIGGDLNCISSDTSGPNRGSVFEIRMPIAPVDGNMSGPSTPIRRTPTPSLGSRGSPDVEGYPSLPEIPRSVPRQDITSPRHRLSLPTAVGALSISPPPERPQRPITSGSRSRRTTVSPQQPTKKMDFDRKLAEKHPITFLVAEDNRINRKLLVNMLGKMGYNDVYEAFDGADAVRQMEMDRGKAVDVVLMDLWMPEMDGYEAAQRILSIPKYTNDDGSKNVTILAVTADVTSEALEHAAQVGMEGFMTKPYKLLDLERLILEFCAQKDNGDQVI
jgi:CheY-like chemotaxis protein